MQGAPDSGEQLFKSIQDSPGALGDKAVAEGRFNNRVPDSTPIDENRQIIVAEPTAAAENHPIVKLVAPEIIDNGEEFILKCLGAEQLQRIERAVAKFNEITVDYGCSVGK